MTSYQANFASHTRDRHVGFQFTSEGIGKSDKMYHYFLFSSYHNTKLQPSDKNINTHTRMKISNPSMLLIENSPFRTVHKETREFWKIMRAYRVVQTLYLKRVKTAYRVTRLYANEIYPRDERHAMILGFLIDLFYKGCSYWNAWC